ncbi:MAG: hypothetical protein ACLFU0_04250 [Alphaproteobacteria bacterium]
MLRSSVTGYPPAAYHRDRPPALDARMKSCHVGGLADALLSVGATSIVDTPGWRITRAAASPS